MRVRERKQTPAASPGVNDEIASRLPAAFCALLLSHRSRAIHSLRPAAVAVAAFCALDAARLVGLPPMADVVAFVVMPACWGALLQMRCDDAADSEQPQERREEPEGSNHANVTPLSPVRFRPLAVKRVLKIGAALRRRRGEHLAILPRLAPLALCLLFSLLLLLSRHHPAVAAHWHEALAVPRLVVGGVALWVALKSRGPRANPEPTVTFEPTLSTPGGVPVASAPCSRNLGGGTYGRLQESYPLRLPPSTLIGIILALGSAACVVGGLWAGDWGGVRAVSLVSWGLVVGVAWRAKG